MDFISTKNAPQAIGPYSQAVKVENFIYTSGQIALTPEGSDDILHKGIEEQTKQVLNNLKNVLEAAGSGLEKVIKTTIFLADMNDFSKVNSIYEEFFKTHKPARSTVAVKTLPKNALIEIEAIAIV
ncbi:RidA family protein [Nitrosophilus kaiyonis]|uniref:RidA family protein n=1 Tax=Nitrosophilus kaiyonis TaxID=2930200 RepID=UPI002493A660|nr:RidA family protein [Nitrosophilus kaiyonis]